MADSREDAAIAFFGQGQHEEALNVWYDMVQAGKVTSGIYYNIGLAESRLGNTPKAMLAFEKASRLKPSGKLITEAIVQEREKIENAIIPVQPFFLAEWSRGLLAVFRPGYWAFFGLLVLLIAMIRFLQRHKRIPGERDLPLRNDLVFTGSGLLLLLVAFLSYASLYRGDEAVLQKSCEIRQAASENSPALIALSPGEKLIILDQVSGWYNVRLLNLEEGWVKLDCLALIEMGKP